MRGLYIVSGDERIPRCPDHGWRGAGADPSGPVRVEHVYPAFERRVKLARIALRCGASREEVRTRHGDIVLRTAEANRGGQGD